MPRKSHATEPIFGRLREAKVLLGQGQTVGENCQSLNISEQTHYRWRKEYGGLRTDQARRLKERERENTPLGKLVAALLLDMVLAIGMVDHLSHGAGGICWWRARFAESGVRVS